MENKQTTENLNPKVTGTFKGYETKYEYTHTKGKKPQMVSIGVRNSNNFNLECFSSLDELEEFRDALIDTIANLKTDIEAIEVTENTPTPPSE